MKRGVWNSEVKTCERRTPLSGMFHNLEKKTHTLQARSLCEPLSATELDCPKAVFPSCSQARFKSQEQLRQRSVAEAWRPAQDTENLSAWRQESDELTSVSLHDFDQSDKIQTKDEQTTTIWPVFCSVTDTNFTKATKETASSVHSQGTVPEKFPLNEKQKSLPAPQPGFHSASTPAGDVKSPAVFPLGGCRS